MAKSFRLQFETEEEASTARKLDQKKDDIWSATFEGLKVHEQYQSWNNSQNHPPSTQKEPYLRGSQTTSLYCSLHEQST